MFLRSRNESRRKNTTWKSVIFAGSQAQRFLILAAVLLIASIFTIVCILPVFHRNAKEKNWRSSILCS
jgi:hypothetical protein